MAMLTEPHTATFSIRGYILDLWTTLQQARAKRTVYRKTVAELSDLGNRELADLGISRGQIHALAMDAAYGG